MFCVDDWGLGPLTHPPWLRHWTLYIQTSVILSFMDQVIVYTVQACDL